MKRRLSLFLSILLLLSALAGLSACGIRRAAEAEVPPTPEPTAEALQEADQEAVIEPAEPEAPEEVQPSAEIPAAIPGAVDPATLPPKPDVDIYSWEYIFNNSYNSIGEFQAPYGTLGQQGIHANIVQQAMDFMQGARDAGFNIWCSRALRNYEYQDSTFQDFRFNHAEDAYSAALQMLGPGLSDHQTGLALDFTDDINYDSSYTEFEDDYMKDTELYKWLVEHCADYGFILRYPEGKEAFYGTPCNHPAHFRYVGKEAAKYIMENNLCLEEFIMLYDESLVYLPKP